MTRAKSPDWQGYLEQRAPAGATETSDFWAALFRDQPNVLHSLLEDVYRATYGADHPPSLGDLWALFEQDRFSDAPFPQALEEALAGRSHRWLAQQAGIPRATLGDYVRGRLNVVDVASPKRSMERLESFATALRVHPSYFSEWRQLWIMHLIEAAFAGRPQLSTAVYRRFARLAPHENGR